MMKSFYKKVPLDMKFIFIISFIYISSIIIGSPIGCIIYRLTGIECMSCGMTTAWYWLLKGDVSKAFYYHPLFIFPLIIAIIYCVDKYYKKINNINYIYIMMGIIVVVVYLLRVLFDFDMFIPLDTHLG